MMTSLENIPLNTSSTININDDSDDPMVQNILNEFNKENQINNNIEEEKYIPQTPPPIPQMVPINNNNNYIINNDYKKKNKSIYNEELLRKTGIIIIIIAFVFSPYIYNILIENLPLPFSNIFKIYELYIKLIIVFILIYLLMYNKMI